MSRLLPIALALAFLVSCSREPDPTLARMMEQRRVDVFEQEMRSPPPDTVSRDDDRDREPPAVDATLLAEGKDHFRIACAACHGPAGDGKSYVAERMKLRPPPSLVTGEDAELPRERLFQVVTEGYGMMPSLAPQLDHRARWAVVSYVESLRRKP